MVKRKTAKAEEGLTLHTTFRLPQELHDRLMKAKGDDKGIGEEIRRRLEASFEGERDEPTRALVAPITEAVTLVGQFFDDWRKDVFAFGVLQAAIEAIVERQKPAGAAELRFNANGIGDLIFKTTDTPSEAGKTVAGLALHRTGDKQKD